MKHINEGWILLMVEAKQLGLSHQDIRAFLHEISLRKGQDEGTLDKEVWVEL
ncbi:DNA-binding anti-repressor SinI [Pseudalkalibacillus sp. A8]|uniref:DNA-binding anti-repressor SinI n=1 Tax=Pseudalkalibacillus sp. A8 TaxID=3382641 RepID=UPI0038B5C2D7